MTKLLKGVTIGGGVLLTVGTGAGIALGVVVPKTLKLKDGISKFVPVDGRANYGNFSKSSGINYVALGDSETAGYNGFMHGYESADTGDKEMLTPRGDYISYADFLANDLKNAHRLNTYHNYAISGATIAQQQEMFGENDQIHDVIKKADFITFTIGANDLLSFVKILKLQFSADILGLINDAASGKVKTVTAVHEIREKLFRENPSDNGGVATNAGKTQEDVYIAVKDSIIQLIEMAKSKDYSHIIDIEKDFKDIIFDLLYRNMMMFIHDLHEIAPDAQLLVLGHAMPFAQWPRKVIETKREDLNGSSIKDLYGKLMKSMKDAANFSLTGSSDYSSFLEVDKLKVTKSSDQTRDGEGKVFDDYIKYDNRFEGNDYYVQNAMPNAADIHPSTFGHELIGNSIFSEIYSHLGLTEDATSLYTFSERFTDYSSEIKTWDEQFKHFVAWDENKDLVHNGSDMIFSLLNGDGLINDIFASDGGDLLEEVIRVPSGVKLLGALTVVLGGDALSPEAAAELMITIGEIKSELDETAENSLFTDTNGVVDTEAQIARVKIVQNAKGLIDVLISMFTTTK